MGSDIDEMERLASQLKKKTAELDAFIYRAAHDLRGPLATIKGLINLLKIRENNDELERFLLLIDSHANKLDERLFQLVYLAAADQEKSLAQHPVDFNGIETSLRRIIEQNAFVDFLELHYLSPPEKIEGVDDILLSSFLEKILLYLLSLTMSTTHVQVFFRLSHEDGFLKINVAAQGFETSSAMRAAIHQSESMYTDLIHYPQLVNFYAAQKIARRLKAPIRVTFVGEDKQRVSVYVPVAS